MFIYLYIFNIEPFPSHFHPPPSRLYSHVDAFASSKEVIYSPITSPRCSSALWLLGELLLPGGAVRAAPPEATSTLQKLRHKLRTNSRTEGRVSRKAAGSCRKLTEGSIKEAESSVLRGREQRARYSHLDLRRCHLSAPFC